MKNINYHFFDIGHIETLACKDSPLHRLDPRVKVITTILFIMFVVSFNKYAISSLIPFFLFPIVLIVISGLSFKYIFKKVLIISPFAIFIAMFNPMIDKKILFYIGSFGINGGCISFVSIIMKFFLTVSSVLILIASTGFNAVCMAISRFGIPKIFVNQLFFLYRYIFVLMEEAERMMLGISLRSFKKGQIGFKTFVSLIGHLLLRTMDRANRIYTAMCCRRFDGNIRLLRTMKIGNREIIFIIFWIFLFWVLRFYDISMYIGKFIIGEKL